MYGRKRKSPYSGFGGEVGRKRRQTSRGAYFRPARPAFAGSNRRSLPYRRTASQVIIRQPRGLPDRLYVRLTYREQLNWTTASGALADNVYRGNSCFDPDLTGAGGQPLGFDQWANFYYSYTVLGSRIEVTSQVNSGGCATQRHGVTPDNLSNVYGAAEQERAEEQPYTKAVTPLMGAGGTSCAGSSVIKAYMSTAKMIGVVRPAVQIEDGYGALVSANPSNTWFWHVWNYVPTGETQSLVQNVRITYYVVFETRTRLDVS